MEADKTQKLLKEKLKEKGLKVDAYALDDPEDITGVNDQEQLAAAAVVIRRRIAGNKAKNRR